MEKTVRIKRLSSFVTIPLSRYNKQRHELYEEPEPAVVVVNPRIETSKAPKLIVKKKKRVATKKKSGVSIEAKPLDSKKKGKKKATQKRKVKRK